MLESQFFHKNLIIEIINIYNSINLIKLLINLLKNIFNFKLMRLCLEVFIFLKKTKSLKYIYMSDITSRVKAIIVDKLGVDENRSC